MPDYKAHLTKLHKNLNILREREAKHGSEPPLTLLNQIDDHQQAITLTEQAIAGQLNQAQWREALKPLLISLNLFGDFFTTIPLQRPPRAEHFTGREKELAQLLADLQPGRVVTLCGPGGIGKTALAAEALWTLAPGDTPPDRFSDGLIFHSFYNQPQAALALEAIVRAFGEEPKPTPRDAARRVLANRQALLVLDGAEAADDLPAVLDLRGGCGVLVTSRRHRDAVAEWQDITPLPVIEAVSLLRAWSKEQAADEIAAERICELVGRLPLAVRLVGRYLAETGEMVAEYLEWLAETPIRALDQGHHRVESVDILLKKSLAQVSQEAQEALVVIGQLALAPFAIQPISEAMKVPVRKIKRLLGELVNYGLLLRSGDRYEVSHALIHTYTRRRMQQKTGIMGRLARYYDALIRKQSKLGLNGYRQLGAERTHIIALLKGCVEQEDWERGRNLAWVVDSYLDIQGHWTERITAAEVGLATARALGRRRDEGVFLGKLGNTHRNLGQYERAVEFYEQALIISREVRNRGDEENHLGNLGLVHYSLDRYEQAIKSYQQALAIAREIADQHGEARHLNGLGLSYRKIGRIEQAMKYHEQAIAIAQEIGDRRGEGEYLGNLGIVYEESMGSAVYAIGYYEQSLAIAREVGDRRNEGFWLGSLATFYRDIGQVEQAIEYHKQALAIAQEIGDRRGEHNQLGQLGIIYQNMGLVEQAIEYYEKALPICRKVENRNAESRCLIKLGNTYSALGQVEKAIESYEQVPDVISYEIRHLRDEGRQLGSLRNPDSVLGRIEQAIEYSKQTLTICQEISYRWGEAILLHNIGELYRNQVNIPLARQYLSQAQAIYKEITTLPYAEEVRRSLDGLDVDLPPRP